MQSMSLEVSSEGGKLEDLSQFAERLAEQQQKKEPIDLKSILTRIKETKFGAKYVTRFAFFLFYLYLTTSALSVPEEEKHAGPVDEDEIAIYEEPDLPVSMDE